MARGRAAVIEKGQAAFYLHVDDGVFIAERGTDEAASQCISTVAALEEAGFDVPNVQSDAELLKVIGIEPERSPARLRLPADRAALLQSALRHMVSLAIVDVAVLRSLVGVWVWAALLRRDLLCIPAAIFKFMDAYEGQVTLWWRSARREAACMATAIGAFYADLGAPLAPVIFATDAMGAGDEDAGGFGIVAKNVGSCMARTCYELGRRPGYSVTKLSGEFTGLKSPHDQIFRRIPFTCLPRELLEDSGGCWKRADWGRWRYADHITLGECRTVVRLLRGIAQCPSAHRTKVLSLQGNGATAGASAKGRSPAPALNFLLRQKTASAVAAEVFSSLPWVQTKVMPADDLSRLLC